MNSLRFLNRIWQALPLSDRSRWWLVSAVLTPVLPLVKDGVVHNAYLREKDWQSKRLRPFAGDPFPTLAPQEKADILIWGVIDWRLRIQRPQHLARGFAARGHRVFYVSTQFVNNATPGFEVENMDELGRLFNLRIHLKGRPRVNVAPKRHDIESVKASIAKLLQWSGSCDLVSIVQHPYWHDVVCDLPGSRMIYDCLDHFGGFGYDSPGLAALELALLKNADAVVATSQWLHNGAAKQNTNVALIRNAAEYDFFATQPASVFQDPQGRRVLGYYGAIANWMDVDLVTKVARQFPDCLLLLVGANECGIDRRLADFPNVKFTGEVNYTSLPYYLYGMDVCLLPFRVVPLTIATNPVKVYEYLSAGKPVVAVNLPELAQFDSLVASADSHDQFIALVRQSLTNVGDENSVLARRAFAARHTWDKRVEHYLRVISTL